MKKSFSSEFKDIKEIVNSLSNKELLYICNGNFVDSPYVKYRECIKIDNKSVGFIELYELEGEESLFITIVVKKEYRGMKLANILLDRMFNYYSDKKHYPFMWRADKENINSIKLAEKYNFKLVNETETKFEYIK